MESYTFPAHFFWGAATSAHQVEGSNHNDWTEWEEKTATEKMGRAQFVAWPEKEVKSYPSPFNESCYRSGLATDHYNRYAEDFDIAKSLGHNAHRFSIEWSRIEPEEGVFDDAQIEHYRQVIQALRERGMEPFVTLWHWTLPVWVSKQGGWLSSKTPRLFARYVEKIAAALGGDVQFWCTLNGPTTYAIYGYLLGIRPPEQRNIWHAYRVLRRMDRGHRLAYRALHHAARQRKVPCNVGITRRNRFFMPPDVEYANGPTASFARFLWNSNMGLGVEGKQDFLGLSYYEKDIDTPMTKEDAQEARNFETGEIPAKELYQALIYMRSRKLPIYVLENGLDDSYDVKRPIFIYRHIKAIGQAMADGADVRGYFHWSLLDSFEWERGFWPRFGLVEVDYKTQERRVRASARAYKEIVQKNAV